jgi:hypothetical protein
VFVSGSCRPLLDFTAIHFDGCGAFGADEVVVVCGSARPINLFAAPRDSVG